MNAAVKVAFVTSEFPHERTPGLCGGIGTSILNLGTALKNAGAQVSVLVYGQEADESFETDGMTIYRIQNVTKGKLHRFYTQRKISKLINRLVAQDKINIVEAPDWKGVSSFFTVNCPVVVKIHGSETYFAHFDGRKVKWRIRMAERLALQRSNAVISVSQYAGRQSMEIFVLNKKFTVIPNGIDIQKFSVAKDPANATLLYFGTLVRKKGTLELPAIFNRVHAANPNARLVLAGIDSNDPATGNRSVWQMVQDGLTTDALAQTSYTGPLAYDRMAEMIAQSAICVFPSYAEALPVSWIEAMAMGKAVVASNIGWASELIDDDIDGCLVHPSDHAAFADRIVALLADENRRTDLGLSARKKIENKLTINKVANLHLAFYTKLISP